MCITYSSAEERSFLIFTTSATYCTRIVTQMYRSTGNHVSGLQKLQFSVEKFEFYIRNLEISRMSGRGGIQPRLLKRM